jgi:hypothetical protein
MFQLNSSIVEVAAEEVVVFQSQLTRDKNKFQGQTFIIEEDIAIASRQPMLMSPRYQIFYL